MASYRKRGTTWRAELYRDGKRESATFRTKAEAVAWADKREAELVGRTLPDNTLKQALSKYAEEVAPTHRGARWEIARCNALGRARIASRRLAAVTPADLGAWRDERLETVAPGTVLREMNLLRSVFEVARKEWGWLRVNPILDVRRPQKPPSRRRRITQDEIDRLTLALGYDGGEPQNLSQTVALAFLFAIETAMRAGEILGLRWSDVGTKSVQLQRTKNGDARAVPLTSRAREILALLPRDDGAVFKVDDALRDALFRKARKRAEIANLRFHDSRAEAIWRLSKKLDVMELARAIGHRDLRSLMIYYQTTADELADRLG